MADTNRTLAELLALWADNSLGSISAQDGRDFIVSCFSGYGSIFVTGGVTAQTISATPIKISGFATNGPAIDTTPDHTTDQITIGTAGDYNLNVIAGGFTGSNGAVVIIDIRVNGSSSGLPTLTRSLGTPATIGSGACGGQKTLSAGDVITAYVSSPTGTSFTPVGISLNVDRLS